MSAGPLARVWGITIRPRDKLLLIYIADNDADSGVGRLLNFEAAMCFTGMTEKQLHASQERLISDGLVIRDHHSRLRIA